MKMEYLKAALLQLQLPCVSISTNAFNASFSPGSKACNKAREKHDLPPVDRTPHPSTPLRLQEVCKKCPVLLTVLAELNIQIP